MRYSRGQRWRQNTVNEPVLHGLSPTHRKWRLGAGGGSWGEAEDCNCIPDPTYLSQRELGLVSLLKREKSGLPPPAFSDFLSSGVQPRSDEHTAAGVGKQLRAFTLRVFKTICFREGMHTLWAHNETNPGFGRTIVFVKISCHWHECWQLGKKESGL